jgi:hypothetical protein
LAYLNQTSNCPAMPNGDETRKKCRNATICVQVRGRKKTSERKRSRGGWTRTRGIMNLRACVRVRARGCVCPRKVPTSRVYHLASSQTRTRWLSHPPPCQFLGNNYAAGYIITNYFSGDEHVSLTHRDTHTSTPSAPSPLNLYTFMFYTHLHSPPSSMYLH